MPFLAYTISGYVYRFAITYLSSAERGCPKLQFRNITKPPYTLPNHFVVILCGETKTTKKQITWINFSQLSTTVISITLLKKDWEVTT